MQAARGTTLTTDGTAQTPREAVAGEVERAGPAEGPAAAHGRRPLAWFAAVAVFTLLVDLASKIVAVAGLEGREPVRLLGGAVYLVLTRNSGAAFSLGSGYTVVLTAIAIVVIAVICWIARRLGSAPWALSLGLILGGAAGNLVDRLFRAPGPFQGAVIDFISVLDDSGGVWPVFNLADSCLVVGVAVALWLELTGRRMDGSRVRHSERDHTER